MSSPDELRAAARRARADGAELRRLAARLDQTALHDLPRLGGDRAWVGPTALAFEQVLTTARRELAFALDDLRRHAATLDHEAADLDRAAARAELAVPALVPTAAGSWQGPR